MPIVRGEGYAPVNSAVYFLSGKPIRLSDQPITEKEAKAMIRHLVNHIAKGCPHYITREARAFREGQK